MKIYTRINKPQGIGYEEVDYEALFQSGYTAGYESGYTAGYDDYECQTLSVDKDEIYFNFDGGQDEFNITCRGNWYISGDYYFFEVSAVSGEGDSTVIVSCNPFTSDCSCDTTIIKEIIISNDYGESVTVSLTHSGQDKALHGLYYDFISASGASFVSDDPLAIRFPSTGGSYRLEVWFGNATAGTETDFNVTSPYSNITVTKRPYYNRWFVDVEVDGFDMEEWEGNRPGSRMLEIGYNYCHNCSHTDRMYFSVSVETIPLPEADTLIVNTDLPSPAQGEMWGIVPQTGGIYTMVISGNCPWQINLFPYGPGDLCTFDVTSGAAYETTTVTVTFSNNQGNAVQGLIELTDTSGAEIEQNVNYFTYMLRQEGAPN